MLTVKVEDEEAGSSHSAASSPERCRLRFRGFRYPEAAGPRAALRRLRQLCRLWLRPETRSKEQIVELLVLEQFLAILPAELRALVTEHQLEDGEEVVTLLEDVERQIDELGRPVSGRRRACWAGEPGEPGGVLWAPPWAVSTEPKSVVLAGSQGSCL